MMLMIRAGPENREALCKNRVKSWSCEALANTAERGKAARGLVLCTVCTGTSAGPADDDDDLKSLILHFRCFNSLIRFWNFPEYSFVCSMCVCV